MGSKRKKEKYDLMKEPILVEKLSSILATHTPEKKQCQPQNWEKPPLLGVDVSKKNISEGS